MPQGKGEIFWLPMLLLLTQLHKLTQIVSSTMLIRTWLIIGFTAAAAIA
jgi:hypothetical protein